jgi:hypothetical protein
MTKIPGEGPFCPPFVNHRIGSVVRVRRKFSDKAAHSCDQVGAIIAIGVVPVVRAVDRFVREAWRLAHLPAEFMSRDEWPFPVFSFPTNNFRDL